MSQTYVCDKHGSTVQGGTCCPDCVEAFANRRDAKTMTPQERADEFRWWGSILTIPFGDLQQRIEELVGRSVWTHELASPDRLIQEIERQQPASFSDVLGKIPDHVQTIVVAVDGPG